MNKQPTAAGARIMAYVHGQLPEAERTQTEKRLFTDPAMAQALREVQGLDRMLRENLGAEDAQEALVDRLLETFDGDHNSSGAIPATSEGGMNSWWMRSRRWIPVAAALTLLLAGIQFLLPQPNLRWGTPSYTVPQYRGDPAEAQDLLDHWYTNFKQQVTRAHEAAAVEASSGQWKLAVSLSELPNGEYRVLVQALSSSRDKVTRQWELFVADLKDLADAGPAWANEVGQDLAAPVQGP